MGFRTAFLILLLLPVFLAAEPRARGGENLRESWRRDLHFEEQQRILDLIAGLNASYRLRRPTVEQLIARSTGPSRALVFENLRQSLQHPNIQIREGAIETMARIGNPAFLPDLHAALIYEPAQNIRIITLSMLPAFLVRNDAIREELIETLWAADFRLSARLQEILSARPLRKDGDEQDPVLARTRRETVEAVASQLDPVGAILDGVRRGWKDQADAVIPLHFFCQDSVGDIPLEKLDAATWRSLRPQAKLEDPEFVGNLQQRTALLLGAMGALSAWRDFEALGRVNRSAARMAALEALPSLCRLAHARWNEDTSRLQSGGASEAEVAWRQEEQENAVSIVRTSFDLAKRLLEDETSPEVMRARSFELLGATRWPSAMPVLRHYGVRTEQPPHLRARVAEALGEIGGEEPVKLLAAFSVYKGYGATTRERLDEYHTVFTAIQALGRIAARPGDAGARAAVAELAHLLLDTRNVEGMPLIRDLALRELQVALGRSETVPPEGTSWVAWQSTWLDWFDAASPSRLTASTSSIPDQAPSVSPEEAIHKP